MFILRSAPKSPNSIEQPIHPANQLKMKVKPIKDNLWPAHKTLGLGILLVLVAFNLQVATNDIKCGQSSAIKSHDRIHGGWEAIPGEAPFMASLKFSGRHYCGGVIIDHQHILTAAHCLVNLDGPGFRKDISTLEIVLGGHNSSELASAQLLAPAEMVVHEKFVPERSPNNDIAIIRTKSMMDWRLTHSGLGSVNRICLPKAEQKYRPGELVFAAGWGSTRVWPSVPTDVLLAVDLRIMSCNREDDLFVCTSVKENKMPCGGDSGGPLFRRLESGQAELVGLVSNGPACFLELLPFLKWKPSYYSNVAHYLPWIEAYTGRH